MTEIHGVTGAPYKHPEVRRSLPAPFTRDRIDLDGGTRIKRSWKDTSVLELKRGDTVANFGVVEWVNETMVMPELGDTTSDSDWRVRLHNKLGDYADYNGHQRVYAFTPDPVE